MDIDKASESLDRDQDPAERERRVEVDRKRRIDEYVRSKLVVQLSDALAHTVRVEDKLSRQDGRPILRSFGRTVIDAENVILGKRRDLPDDVSVAIYHARDTDRLWQLLRDSSRQVEDLRVALFVRIPDRAIGARAGGEACFMAPAKNVLAHAQAVQPVTRRALALCSVDGAHGLSLDRGNGACEDRSDEWWLITWGRLSSISAMDAGRQFRFPLSSVAAPTDPSRAVARGRSPGRSVQPAHPAMKPEDVAWRIVSSDARETTWVCDLIEEGQRFLAIFRRQRTGRSAWDIYRSAAATQESRQNAETPMAASTSDQRQAEPQVDHDVWVAELVAGTTEARPVMRGLSAFKSLESITEDVLEQIYFLARAAENESALRMMYESWKK